MKGLNIVWSLLGAILVGSCQTIPSRTPNASDAAATKGAAQARTEGGVPEDTSSGKTYHQTQTVEQQNIVFRIESTRKSNNVPKIKPKAPNDGKKREWRLFYISMKNQSMEPVPPGQHPSFRLINAQGLEYSEEAEFNKQANLHTDYTNSKPIPAHSKMSKAVGFYVPVGETYTLAVQVPSRTINKPANFFYYTLQTDE